MVITYGLNSLELAKKVAETAETPLINKIVRVFPDGEIYVRFENIDFEGKEVYVIHSLYPEQNQNLIELFLTLDLIKDYGGKIKLIVPYFAYSRQDKRFQDGEAFSLKTIANILKFLGVEYLITIDAHFHRKPEEFDFFGVPAKNLTAVNLLVNYAKNYFDGFIVIGPDLGSKDFLSSIKEEKIFLEKEKYCPECKLPATKCKCIKSEKEYEIKIKCPNLRKQNVLILDDMIAGGGTMIRSIEAIKEKVNKIAVGCTHGLFLKDSLQKLKNLSDYIFTTDTIKSEVSKVSVAELIAKEIKK